MTSDRKKPFWPWIVGLLLGLPVLYVASFGPACWLKEAGAVRFSLQAWRPLARLAARCPVPLREGYSDYLEACSPRSAPFSFGRRMILDEYRHHYWHGDFPVTDL